MTHFRATLRLVAIVLIMLTGSLLLALLGLVPGGPSGWAAGRREALVGAMARAGARTCGMSVRTSGPLPQAPFILVANHLSYMDIVLIRSLLPVHFVSKAEVARWPIVGWMASLAGTLFLNRRNKRSLDRTNTQLGWLLEAGRSVAFFPEGTSSSGEEVLPFHSGLMAWPAEVKYPIHSAAIRYATGPPEMASSLVCWWGDMTFLDHLYSLLKLPGFRAIVSFSTGAIQDDDRKRLAGKLERAVREQFVQAASLPVS